MLDRRTLLQGTLLAAALPSSAALAAAMPGVTKGTIKIGNTIPYSGPGSAYGAIGRADTAYFKMVNEKGGIGGGRKIDFISVDDGYSPPRTVEETRKLVEADGVSFIFNGLGTPTQSGVQKYMNARKVPQLFVSTGADKWGDPKHFPWTMGWQPSYRTEAQIYAKYIVQTKPGAKIGILYQNDDFGKDYVTGLKEGLGGKKTMIVKEVSYETTDPTIDSQAVSLQSAGCDIVLTAAIPKFAAQMIRKMADMNYKPLHIMSNVSISVGSVIQPAGPQNATGMISAAYLKDNTDPQWKNDPGMNQWRAFMTKYMPGADINEANHVYGFGVSMTMEHVLRQCGTDLSRANIMKQAASIDALDLPVLLPGIKVSTSATNFHPIRSMQLERWTGSAWQLFGTVIAGA